ncbi:NAD-dependent DNA ligase LigA [Anaerosacchariphilus polymeriproducens]|uniref:DNA ligase n=1 Tax=Anaerosacchariphilus polymeriproducens TaxID=1812858 RepID=A0A371B038_9FIRM|nr:NAD-dependent DNA ligase LigA [Anaerosacchariphilus polymeriproducens]RDU25195.1 NAD-dependent DNA ligase LigA [Anaerosacchariphilus polymeriproducens]
MKSKQDRMKELVTLLNKAGKAYYQEDREIMTNYEYDKLYDELVELEKETGIIQAGSPTISVGYEILTELPKEIHESPMLSLDKTKDLEALKEFVGDKEAILSWKLDGLTIVLTFENGVLVKAVTRGNGEIGEVITNNARVFKNLPLQIPYKGRLVLRGEAVISYSDFIRINEEIEGIDAKYKNPRNLCSGSVRQLNNEITAKRNVNFIAFSIVNGEGINFKNSREEQFRWLSKQGFQVVEHKKVTAELMEETVKYFSDKIKTNEYPSDGLVLVFDDIAFGESLGRTAKFPKDSIAYKWQDEIMGTKLLNIEWSASRTGLINPIAVFEPVELEGTTVSRASVHNVSIVEELQLGIGDEIEVYKANMIIPQIAKNLTKSGNIKIPAVCPVCGGKTEIKRTNQVKVLYCINPDCSAKHLKAFTLLVSRNALNIDGFSQATLEKFIGKGFIKDYADIFHLDNYQEEIVEMEGFGKKSYENLIKNIEKARNTTLPRVIYALGIPNIGLSNAKMICKEFNNSINDMLNATPEQLNEIDGIGEVIAKSFVEFFEKENHRKSFEDLLKELHIETDKNTQVQQKFEGMNFVITGSVEHFENRNEAKEYIEARGGKVTGSVTSKTNYLINNDVTSNSSKNKKAKELGVKIISEQDLLNLQ